jgi:hypothetical protein
VLSSPSTPAGGSNLGDENHNRPVVSKVYTNKNFPVLEVLLRNLILSVNL